MGRPIEFNAAKKEELCRALQNKLPFTYACDLVGIDRETGYRHLKSDKNFAAKVRVSKAIAIQALVETTEKQTGAWKLLKNLGKEEFKEHVEILYTASEEEELVAPDGTSTTDQA